jgi:hypothetical protein
LTPSEDLLVPLQAVSVRAVMIAPTTRIAPRRRKILIAAIVRVLINESFGVNADAEDGFVDTFRVLASM